MVEGCVGHYKGSKYVIAGFFSNKTEYPSFDTL